MPDSKPIHVEVAYTGMVTHGNGRTPFRSILATTVPVKIPEVPAAGAPVVIEAEWPEGYTPRRMAWREHGGALWRPLVDIEGGVLDAAGGLARGIELAMEPQNRRLRDGWSDYPFNAPDERGYRGGQAPWSASRDGDPGLKVRTHNRDAAIADAQRIAADDLLMVDGVLHRRTPAPVWGVGNRDRVLIDPGIVTLAIPDLKAHDDWLASFPLDRKDEAVAYAEDRVERVAELPWLGTWGKPEGKDDVMVVEVAVRHHGGPFPDTRADDLRRAFEAIEDNWGSVELKRLSRRFLKAYGALAGAVQDIVEDGAEPSWTDAAEAAVRAVVEAGDPEWPNTWMYAAEIVEGMRAFARRHELTNQWDADAEVTSVPGLAR